MAKILKQVRCGRLVCAVVYTAPSAGDAPRARAQKQKASTAARERLNARTSVQKLKQVLAANFDDGDLFLTLTFDDKHLPEDRERTIRRARSFWGKLRAARRARGQTLRYVYVVEGHCPGGRPHIHAVVNSTGEDLAEAKRLWTYGDNVELRRLTFSRDYTYADLAGYLTKEPREWGRPHIGERNWMPSLGLAKPEPETLEVSDLLTLEPPPEALAYTKVGPERNGYGEWCWLEYLLPSTSGRRPRAKRRRRRKKE